MQQILITVYKKKDEPEIKPKRLEEIIRTRLLDFEFDIKPAESES